MNYQTLPVSHARSLRRSFIERFVDKRRDCYRAVMCHGDSYGASAHKKSLWEAFSGYNIISRKAALALLSTMPEVYLTWDASPANISRNLQKSRLIKLSGKDLSAVLSSNEYRSENVFCTEDIYVFTPDLSQHITFTHEYVKGYGHICLTSISSVSDPYISPAFRELFNEMCASRCGAN